MLRHALSISFAALFFCGHLAAQTVRDVLPECLEQDSAGKLQWTKFVATTCPVCEGKKTTPCPICGKRTYACDLCTEQRTPCAACDGTGVARDPFRFVLCNSCYGIGQETCPGCQNHKRVITPEGEDVVCSGCKGQGKLTCALCAGHGWLPAINVAGRDPRVADAAALEATRNSLAALEQELEAIGGLGYASAPPNVTIDTVAIVNAADYGAFLDKVRGIVPIPEGLLERIEALDRASDHHDEEFVQRWVCIQHRNRLESYIDEQRRLIEFCLWRLRFNAGELAVPAPRNASEIAWDGWFGTDDEQREMFTLLGLGFFRTESASDTPAEIAAWLAQHPAAMVRAVTKLENPTNRGPSWTFCWVADGRENLNLHLVRRGCVPGDTMNAFGPDLLVPPAEYASFLQDVARAEQDARQEGLGIWKAPDPAEADPLTTAEQLMGEEKYREALDVLRPALTTAAPEERARIFEKIADCQASLDEWQEQLEAYTNAIAAGGRSDLYRYAARCMSQHLGLAAAVSWLEERAKSHPTDPDFPRMTGSLLCEEDDPAGMQYYERALELMVARHDLEFDADGQLVANEALAALEEQALAEFVDLLDDVARWAYPAGDPQAFRYATMGVAVGSELLRRQGWHDETNVVAGSFRCRMVRAYVFVDRDEFDAAEKETRLARAIARADGERTETRDYERIIAKRRDDHAREERERAPR